MRIHARMHPHTHTPRVSFFSGAGSVPNVDRVDRVSHGRLLKVMLLDKM